MARYLSMDGATIMLQLHENETREHGEDRLLYLLDGAGGQLLSWTGPTKVVEDDDDED